MLGKGGGGGARDLSDSTTRLATYRMDENWCFAMAREAKPVLVRFRTKCRAEQYMQQPGRCVLTGWPGVRSRVSDVGGVGGAGFAEGCAEGCSEG
jgi:hypothetical protein